MIPYLFYLSKHGGIKDVVTQPMRMVFTQMIMFSFHMLSNFAGKKRKMVASGWNYPISDDFSTLQ